MNVLLQNGGAVMIVIFVASVLALMIIIERIVFYLQFRRNPQKFVSVIMDKLGDASMPSNINDAIKYSRDVRGPVANLYEMILINRGRSKADLESMVEVEAQKFTPALERWLSALYTIGSISPLLGLLGTVIGMIKSFFVIAKGSVASADLAVGISQALYTTAFGLIVAIPSIVFYNFFSRKVDKIISEIEIYTMELINYLKNN